MAKEKEYQNQNFTGKTVDLERTLVAKISGTGKTEIKKRRKAGLSVFYLKQGKIVEVKPDQTEIEVQSVDSRWVKIEKNKRSILIK
ncbi:hypothetical protein [Chryseolinea lacunae]|uniref:SH3b domain-containing protein n=1 Tax=Chryseolinea lacunae TaxID=2801331 RepID=A0ABS1KKH3_9BACT|nr:hypothetical protein [Chryseolinea lacunae]MBL0739850.1 hypothetical protein [Chryseolinea lacunae]